MQHSSAHQQGVPLGLTRRPRENRSQTKQERPQFGKLSDYTHYEKLGEGTFGVVFKARVQKHPERVVAIKKIIERKVDTSFPLTAFREMEAVKLFHHANVIDFVDFVMDNDSSEKTCIKIPGLSVPNDVKQGAHYYMVFPYMHSDLAGILMNPNIELKLEEIKSIMKQLFKGLDYIHRLNYIHRDIKTANILIDSHGVVKIADLGLIRRFSPDRPVTLNAQGGGVHQLTPVVMTRWYRAPECVLQNGRYGTAVDMWSAGCIFGEMFEKKPIMKGETDVDQGHKIFQMVGFPTDETMPNWKNFPLAKNYPEPARQAILLKDHFEKRLGAEGFDLLKKLLTLDPEKRITAGKAITHSYFTTEPLPLLKIDCKFEESHEGDKEKFRKMRNNPVKSEFTKDRLPPNPAAVPPYKITKFHHQQRKPTRTQNAYVNQAQQAHPDFNQHNVHHDIPAEAVRQHQRYTRTDAPLSQKQELSDLKLTAGPSSTFAPHHQPLAPQPGPNAVPLGPRNPVQHNSYKYPGPQHGQGDAGRYNEDVYNNKYDSKDVRPHRFDDRFNSSGSYTQGERSYGRKRRSHFDEKDNNKDFSQEPHYVGSPQGANSGIHTAGRSQDQTPYTSNANHESSKSNYPISSNWAGGTHDYPSSRPQSDYRGEDSRSGYQSSNSQYKYSEGYTSGASTAETERKIKRDLNQINKNFNEEHPPEDPNNEGNPQCGNSIHPNLNVAPVSAAPGGLTQAFAVAKMDQNQISGHQQRNHNDHFHGRKNNPRNNQGYYNNQSSYNDKHYNQNSNYQNHTRPGNNRNSRNNHQFQQGLRYNRDHNNYARDSKNYKDNNDGDMSY